MSNKEHPIDCRAPTSFDGHMIPPVVVKVQGKVINPKALCELADKLNTLAAIIRSQDELGRSVTIDGGYVFDERELEDGGRSFALNSDMKVTIGPLPAFKWEAGDELKAAHLRISFYTAQGEGGFSRKSDGIEVIHLPTGITAKSHMWSSQFRNRQSAVESLVDKLNERYGVKK